MATSGKSLAIIAFVMLVGSACSQPADEAGTPAAVQQQTSETQSATCQVATPPSWLSMIGRDTTSLPSSSRVVPFAAGAAPDRFFAEVYSPAWSGVVSITSPRGGITRIREFANPHTDQAYAGAFDGRWLVWIVQRSLEDWNDWEIWAWDSTSGESFRIATSTRVDGRPISGPIVQPVVANGVAAWVQANQQGLGDVHMFSLGSRRDAVVATHATTPVTFWGTDLLWMHLDVAGQSGHFEMADPAGRPLAVPEPLASVHGAAYVATSPELVAWTDGTTLWAYRIGHQHASAVFQSTGDHVQFIGIVGDLITWDGSTGPFALDLRTSAVTALTPANGGRFASGTSLLIYWPEGAGKTAAGSMAIADVDATRLPPLPSCA